METTRLSTKGQIIIPKSVREAHNWEAGLEFSVEEAGDAILLRPLKTFHAAKLEDVIGCTGYQGPRHSLEDMEAAIALGARGAKGAPADRGVKRTRR